MTKLRYGTCVCPAPTARTTCPSAVSEALMATACLGLGCGLGLGLGLGLG